MLMKITTYNHPILMAIYEGARLNFDGIDELKEFDFTRFNNKVRYITKPFLDAMIFSSERLLQIPTCEINDCSGVLLLEGNQQVTYIIESGKIVFCSWMVKSQMGFLYIKDVCELWHEKVIKLYKSDTYPLPIRMAVFYELFTMYAEIEVKTLNGMRQIFDGPNCVYSNQTKYPIEIINSTWFTELIKSDAFKVRGHFRLQPFGEGMAKRKLIWINDFQKEGYHRLAKKLYEAA